MGASGSKMEEDKALQLCHERKKFVRQALDGRCLLAATHVTYIQSLKITGAALRRFVGPEAPIESSLYTSTSATPEPRAVTEKSLSQFSLSSPSMSQRVDANDNLSPSPSPPASGRYEEKHMKFGVTFSKKIEEKPPLPVMGSITASSSNPQSATFHSIEGHETSPFKSSPIPPTTPPWDYFGLFHPIDDHLSSQEGRVMNQNLDNLDDIGRLREEEGIPELEDEEERPFSPGREESQDSEDEFDEPSTDTLVRSFENVNRASDHVTASASPAMPPAESVASKTEFLNGEKSNSPALSPLRAKSSEVAVPSDIVRTLAREDGPQNKLASKDIFSCMKDIENLFIKASESGKEVPRMLEANKFHFRPIFPGKERGSVASTLLKSCFSCGEDPSQVQEEPPQTNVKYLTWHRTTSSRSSSSRNPLCSNSKDEIEDLSSNLFDNFCMNSGSHASTLDRLYAWERKLHDEVKASEMVRKHYDTKCKLLRQLESEGVNPHRIDKTRAVVKDLHSRIRVAIHRIDSISKKIEELRDKELQPQLEELIEGLRRMWEVMSECHNLQYEIISAAYNDGNTKISIHLDSHQQITIHLEDQLGSLSTSFTKWIVAQKSYVQAINGWLEKCVTIPQKSSKRSRRNQNNPPWKMCGPPIYVTCGVWLEKLNGLPTKVVADSIKGLAAEITRFLPRQERTQGKGMNHPNQASWQDGSNSDSAVNMLRDEASEDWVTSFDRFRSSLVGFLGQLNNFAGESVKMFTELQKEIEGAKKRYSSN